MITIPSIIPSISFHCDEIKHSICYKGTFYETSQIQSKIIETNEIKDSITSLQIKEIDCLVNDLFSVYKNVNRFYCAMCTRRITPTTFKNATELKVIEIIGNKLGILENYIFMDCKKLKVLDLQMNRIEYIEENAFYGLQHIEKIWLNYNRIKFINFFTFSKIKTIKYLYLMENRLDSLIIKGNIEKIIAEENSISNVMIASPIIFSIKLKFNNLTDFSNLTKLPTLEYLDVSNNNLNRNLRVHGINLQSLDLQNNNLETLTITGTIYNLIAGYNAITDVVIDTPLILCLDLTPSLIQKELNVYLRGLELISCEKNLWKTQCNGKYDYFYEKCGFKF